MTDLTDDMGDTILVPFRSGAAAAEAVDPVGNAQCCPQVHRRRVWVCASGRRGGRCRGMVHARRHHRDRTAGSGPNPADAAVRGAGSLRSGHAVRHPAGVELEHAIAAARDDLADLALLEPVCKALGKRATLHLLDTADHGFRTLKRSRKGEEDVFVEMARVVREWSSRLK